MLIVDRAVLHEEKIPLLIVVINVFVVPIPEARNIIITGFILQ
jgi:hypothetical protein